MHDTTTEIAVIKGRVVLTLIYAAMGLYDTPSLNGFSPKVPMYKNSRTVCIPIPKNCLYTYLSKFMKQ